MRWRIRKAETGGHAFQGAPLVFDLLNCTLLSWLRVRQHGIERQAAPPHQYPPPVDRAVKSHPDGVGQVAASEALSASHSPPAPIDPTALGQGLSILAVLA